MNKMNIFKAAVILTILCTLGVNYAHAKKRKNDMPRGTSAAELAKLKAKPLPQPSLIKVAVLPLWDTSGKTENTRIGTTTAWLLLQREGFTMIPILEGFKAEENDGYLEPGTSVRQEDAVRIGKKIGVDWVVYGEVHELEITRKTGAFFKKKYANASMRLVVVQIPTNQEASQILYWQMRHERVGGNRGLFQGGAHGDFTLKRGASVKVATAILAPFFAAFPTHKVFNEKVNEDAVKAFTNKTWPEEKEDSKRKE